MKKKKLNIFLLLALVLVLAGCGRKEETPATESTTEENGEAQNSDKIYLTRMDVSELVTLGDYKGIEVEVSKPEVTAEMVEDFIQYELSIQAQLGSVQLVPVSDRDTVEEGDTVNIDYEGKRDGIAFEGGTASGHDLLIGSGSFIPGFEDGLIGVKKGETVDIDLTFPADYREAELAGAEVVFTVTVNEILIPSLDDEYAAALGIEGVSTAEDYRQYVKEMLSEQLLKDYKYEVQMEVLTKVMEGCTVQEPPQELQKKYAQLTNTQMERQAAYYGMDLETFVQNSFGVSLEEYQQEVKLGALETAKQAMVCKKIADTEGIQITDEELDQAAEENYTMWGFTDAESFKASNDMEEYRDSMLLDKVLTFLYDNAVVVEPAATDLLSEEVSETEETAQDTTEEVEETTKAE